MFYLILLVALFTVFVTIKPLKIKRVVINMATGSALVIFLLFIFNVIDLEIIYQAIIGNGKMEPWKILVIFFSVAYISVSTDITGFFDYLAYKIVHTAKGNGIKLFVSLYLFAGLLSIFTSNDVVILTLTPIIFYLSKHAKINVIPLLFAEFFAANTFSMFFYIDNPTNIMVVNAMGIGFLEYAKVMFFPTIVAGTTTCILLLILFRKSITKNFQIQKSSAFEIRNWLDAIISICLMVGMLTLLVFSHKLNLEIWTITLSFAVIFAIEDILFGAHYFIKSKGLSKSQLDKRKDVYNIPKEKNEFFLAIKRIPWGILPFIIAFFIMVEALNQMGVINYLAEFISSKSTSLLSSVSITGFLGLIMANIINNQPMTILLSNVLVSNNFVADPTNLKAATYSLIIASNLSANISIIGALAGLMWKKILNVKGVQISYWDFLKKGVLITPVVFIITLCTLLLVIKIA